MRKLISAVLVTMVGTAMFVVAPARAAGILHCGMTISTSIKLDRNLLNCPGDGLIVGANSITIDLHRFTLGGDDKSGGSGINLGSHSGVKVVNGTIIRFDHAVRGSHATANSLDRIETQTSRLTAISFVGGSSRNTLKRISGNEEIEIVGDGNTVINGDLSRSASTKAPPTVQIHGTGNKVSKSSVTGGGTAIDVTGNSNILDSNTLQGGALRGVAVLGNNNRILRNDVGGFRAEGIALRRVKSTGTDNTLDRNTVHDNKGDGIGVAAFDTQITGNTSNTNTGNGFAVSGSNAYLKNNNADDNHKYGIDANATGVQGGSNNASNNTKGQCRPAKLCE